MADLRASLEKAELDFAADTAARGVEGWVAAFADDGIGLDAKGRQTKGKDQIRAKMTPVFAEVKISWKPTLVEVAPDGQMGFTYGLYEVTPRAGEPKVLAHGAYMTVWKRDSARKWKVAADLGAQDRDKPPEQ
jgi:ketosteroid isomerase-like protein